MALMFLLVLAFIGFSVPPYLSLDAGRSRIPPPPDVRAYYPLLVAHVVFASVAMLGAALQIWPWLRRRRPDVHRIVGRAYVFAGVLPAGLSALAIGSVGPFGPVLRASNVVLGILWIASTLTGFAMAQRRRMADHRRWMIRSFTLTLSIITNRVWAVVFTVTLAPQLPTLFGGSELALIQAIAGLSGWLGWVLPLLLCEWWLMEKTPVPVPAPA
jgi:uncharacterized membrane protein YozB (DUF420 family)